ncbi:hypothetical protein ACODM8_10945 [Vibrio ostreicida]|uniref:hypothetical protein n=1 Tax=Vibrio ostreicida TaxID=526588 RepID=UPI003B5BEF30
MAKKRKNAPRGGVKLWRDYLKWLENKNSEPGEFRGNLNELKGSAPIEPEGSAEQDEPIGFKGSTKRGKESNKLNAAIAATPAFEGLKAGQAIEALQKRHPWATKQAISNPFLTQYALLTPHHLISCCVTKALTRHFTDVIENDIGYNVNSPHNLLILPNSTVVACYLGVPLHESDHEYTLSAREKLNIERSSKNEIAGERVWESTFNVEIKGYHAKVLKLVHQVIVKHFKCKKDLDHNKFIADMNQVSKKILKKLAKFHWLLHKNGADYKLGNSRGCCNTRLISSYIHGEGVVDDMGTTKASGRESAKDLSEISHCSGREHKDDLHYFLHKDKFKVKGKTGPEEPLKLNKSDMRSRGMKVATEVEWVMSASTSKTPATQDNKQTETA